MLRTIVMCCSVTLIVPSPELLGTDVTTVVVKAIGVVNAPACEVP